MRKSLFDDKKPKVTKKKDKKAFSKVNKNKKTTIRWSQISDAYTQRLGSMGSVQQKSNPKTNSQKSIKIGSNQKNKLQKYHCNFSASCSPSKQYLLQKHSNKYCTTNTTPKRISHNKDKTKPQPGNNRKNFKFIYQIGFGGFGRVWKVHDKSSERDFAMKQICKKKVIEKNSVECIMNEKMILSNLNSNFLINITQAFQDDKNLYLIMDYLRGADLRYHICYKEYFTENQTKFIIACIIMSLEYIHAKKIIHRDIKPQNLVFQENGYLRLTDFGVAIHCESYNFGSRDSSGTPGYMAPEILFKQSYSYISDFFAIGVIGFQLMMGYRPYQGKCRKEIKQIMDKQQIKIKSEQIPLCWTNNAVDFFNRLLSRNPKERLGSKEGINELKRHKWMKNIDWVKLEKKQLSPPFIPHVICETKDYLDEIILYNEMKEEDEDDSENKLPESSQKLFQGYDFYQDRKNQEQKKWRKSKKPSQRKVL